MGGQRPELRLRVRTFCPRNRVQAMKLARYVETELRGSVLPREPKYRAGPNTWKGGKDWNVGPNLKLGHGSASNPSVNSNRVGSHTPNPSRPSNFRRGSSNNSSQISNVMNNGDERSQSCGVKHLPYSELMDRKAKILDQVQLPPEAKIHPVFHVSHLKPFHGSQQGRTLVYICFPPPGPAAAAAAAAGTKHKHKKSMKKLASLEEASYPQMLS
ncbi:hypothetical protein L195_g018636 [Trifolium pratense]|uniref:Uncharacterized protein n=1 Tax=Trifolium pratense TaxID=57577 RepID=A0A2K3MXI0_TRIPR|nr:hypothetical protein L195_g018636 [Trifolium pratense]